MTENGPLWACSVHLKKNEHSCAGGVSAAVLVASPPVLIASFNVPVSNKKIIFRELYLIVGAAKVCRPRTE